MGTSSRSYSQCRWYDGTGGVCAGVPVSSQAISYDPIVTTTNVGEPAAVPIKNEDEMEQYENHDTVELQRTDPPPSGSGAPMAEETQNEYLNDVQNEQNIEMTPEDRDDNELTNGDDMLIQQRSSSTEREQQGGTTTDDTQEEKSEQNEPGGPDDNADSANTEEVSSPS